MTLGLRTILARFVVLHAEIRILLGHDCISAIHDLRLMSQLQEIVSVRCMAVRGEELRHDSVLGDGTLLLL